MFNKEQLESFIVKLEENINLLKISIKKNPEDENLKSMLQAQKKSMDNYLQQLESVKVGRPSLGITKKISLTLPKGNWEWLDEKAEGNRSKFLREMVWNALGNENEWSNYASLGYAIAGAKKLGYDDEKILPDPC